MNGSGEGLVEAAVAAVVLIVLGTALAPLLPFNFAAIGWLMLIVVAIGAIVAVVTAVSKAVS
jgi:hypothetical protein